MQKTPQTRPTLCLAQRLRYALFAITLLASSSHAADQAPAGPAFSFSGFGTLGLARSSEREADFVAHDLQGGGAGRDHEWSAEVDSKLGLQLTANLTDRLSGVVQVLSTLRYDGTMRPGIEWANLNYRFTPDLSVRAGRVVLGTFLASDYRNVGYALPWVRPPVEVYGLIPMMSTDGLDASYRLHAGEATHTFQVAYGRSGSRVPEGGEAITERAFLLSDTIEYGAATMRLVYTRGRFTLDVDEVEQMFDGYRTIAANPAVQALDPHAAAQAARVVSRYDVDDTPSTFIGIGASYDPGKWFVMSEWGQTDTNSAFGKRAAWYFSGGLRIGKFTPYATYAKATLKSRDSDPGVAAPFFFSPARQAQLGAMNAGLNRMLGDAAVQKTLTLGVRWDFARNAAFKLQYDHSRAGDGSPGTLDHDTAQFRRGGRFDVWSATVDFVF